MYSYCRFGVVSSKESRTVSERDVPVRALIGLTGDREETVRIELSRQLFCGSHLRLFLRNRRGLSLVSTSRGPTLSNSTREKECLSFRQHFINKKIRILRPRIIMNFLVSLFFLSTAVTAFHVQPHAVGRTRLVIEATKKGASIDVARAKECAENFGKCSVEEIKDLRDGKNHLFGGCS